MIFIKQKTFFTLYFVFLYVTVSFYINAHVFSITCCICLLLQCSKLEGKKIKWYLVQKRVLKAILALFFNSSQKIFYIKFLNILCVIFWHKCAAAMVYNSFCHVGVNGKLDHVHTIYLIWNNMLERKKLKITFKIIKTTYCYFLFK